MAGASSSSADFPPFLPKANREDRRQSQGTNDRRQFYQSMMEAFQGYLLKEKTEGFGRTSHMALNPGRLVQPAQREADQPWQRAGPGMQVDLKSLVNYDQFKVSSRRGRDRRDMPTQGTDTRHRWRLQEAHPKGGSRGGYSS